MALTPAQDDIVDRVEYHADQVTVEQQTIGINRQAAYDQLSEAADALIWMAPRQLVEELSADGSGQTIREADQLPVAELLLPDDHLRFLHLQLSSWSRPTYRLIDPRGNAWRLQYNQYTQADLETPTATMSPRSTSAAGADLEPVPESGWAPLTSVVNNPVIYAAPANDTVDTFAYVPETPPEDLDADLKDIVVWMGTSRVLEAQKEAGARAAEDRALSLMQDLKTGIAPAGTYQPQDTAAADE